MAQVTTAKSVAGWQVDSDKGKVYANGPDVQTASAAISTAADNVGANWVLSFRHNIKTGRASGRAVKMSKI